MPMNFRELDALLQPYIDARKPGELEEMLSSSLLSFKIQRPLGRFMIVLMGQSGTGKSATINNVFDDPKLCPTNKVKSETREVTEYSKLINFEDFKACISFVDTPGTFDTQTERNEVNLAKIQEFRTKHPAFGISGSDHRVYPNLLLVTVQASDTRLDDSDSFFSQTLRTIDGTNLLDPSRVNLIVVATFSAHISTESKDFTKEKQRIRYVISEVVHRVLGILNVKIVFVENSPDRQGLHKNKDSDFYGLPDGELMPLNLFKAFRDQFKSNGDFFGSCVAARYFSNKCEEKKDRAVSKSMSEIEQSCGDDEIAAFERITEFCQQNRQALFIMNQYSGCGYSPSMECTKTSQISEKCRATFVTREKVDGIINTEKEFLKLTFPNKEAYESYRHKMYEMDEGAELIISPEICSIGKWENLGISDWNIISFLHEEKLGHISFDEISNSDLTEPLKSALLDLPALRWYDKIFVTRADKDEQLRVFFETWGTHFIKNVKIGGSLRVDCSIPSNWSDEEKSELENRIKNQISFLSTQNGSHDELENIVGGGYIRIKFSGGIPPKVTKLTDITREMFADWVTSLEIHPVELNYTVEIQSYNKFIEENKKLNFKQATSQYMRDCSIQRSANRDQEAAIEEKIALILLWGFADILTAGLASGTCRILKMFGFHYKKPSNVLKWVSNHNKGKD